MTTPSLLFVCTHNAGRSALAAALARQQAGDRVVVSAGVAPAETPSAGTIASLAEIGIDDSAHQPQKITEDLVHDATVVIAMKPGLDLPQVDGVTYETWELPNPQGWEAPAIRPLRDHVAARDEELLRTVDPHEGPRTSRHPESCRGAGRIAPLAARNIARSPPFWITLQRSG